MRRRSFPLRPRPDYRGVRGVSRVVIVVGAGRPCVTNDTEGQLPRYSGSECNDLRSAAHDEILRTQSNFGEDAVEIGRDAVVVRLEGTAARAAVPGDRINSDEIPRSVGRDPTVEDLVVRDAGVVFGVRRCVVHLRPGAASGPNCSGEGTEMFPGGHDQFGRAMRIRIVPLHQYVSRRVQSEDAHIALRSDLNLQRFTPRQPLNSTCTPPFDNGKIWARRCLPRRAGRANESQSQRQFRQPALHQGRPNNVRAVGAG